MEGGSYRRMKLGNISTPIVDLSERPSVAIVTKLKKSDLVVYEGEEWQVEFPPKKVHKGVWYIGLSNDSNKKYVKVVENTKPKMTAHEKKTMTNNIRGVVDMFSENEQRLVKMAKDYHQNLKNHNNYDDKDVRECMSAFPINILKKSGVVL